MRKEGNPTEKLFGEYLQDRGIQGMHEMDSKGTKKPDWYFHYADMRVAVEVKDLFETPLSRELARNGRTFAFVDADEEVKQLRRRVDSACVQLKTISADLRIVILGSALPIRFESVASAVFGKPVIVIPLSRDGRPKGQGHTRILPNGSIRQKDPATGLVIRKHPFLSAVGTIRENEDGRILWLIPCCNEDLPKLQQVFTKNEIILEWQT